jgi:hypothetical protein
MSKLTWKKGSVAELSQTLTHATVESSAEIGGITVYHIRHEGHDRIALSLPNGQALFVESANAHRQRRRRVDPEPSD